VLEEVLEVGVEAVEQCDPLGLDQAQSLSRDSRDRSSISLTYDVGSGLDASPPAMACSTSTRSFGGLETVALKHHQ